MADEGKSWKVGLQPEEDQPDREGVANKRNEQWGGVTSRERRQKRFGVSSPTLLELDLDNLLGN
jgi:hypothetical protein